MKTNSSSVKRATNPQYDSDDARWQAVVAKDKNADGKFWFSVKTTGVYCRPSCSSRPANRENVAFHRSSEEAETGTVFNSCLLNLYDSGSQGMAWHSDDEKSLGKNTTIASLSLGATRKFSLRHKRTGESISIQLEDGSLLIMKGTTQTFWQHSVPKSAKITTPRINLTFRTIVLDETR